MEDLGITEVMGLDSIKTDGKAQVYHLKIIVRQQEYSGWFSAYILDPAWEPLNRFPEAQCGRQATVFTYFPTLDTQRFHKGNEKERSTHQRTLPESEGGAQPSCCSWGKKSFQFSRQKSLKSVKQTIRERPDLAALPDSQTHNGHCSFPGGSPGCLQSPSLISAHAQL